MKAMFGVALVFALSAAPLITPATADHGCNGNVIAVGDLYIDDRSGGEATLDHWIYQESNGEEGLQSGGVGPLDGAGGILIQDDPCAHENPDTLIF